VRTRFSPRILLWMSLAATLLLLPSEALAQRGRGGHGGGGRTAGSGGAVSRGPVHSSRPVYTRPYYRPYYYHSYYRPYYYPYFYSSFYWGWGGFGYYPYGGYPWGYYPYGGYYRPWYDDLGALRVEVKPRDAQVYVDGYFAGLVDDFDGISQRLRAKPGEHQIDVYMPGFQTFSEKMLFRPGQTLKIKTTLQPLAAGEAQPTKPEPTGPPPTQPGSSQYDDPGQAPPPQRAPYRPAPPAVAAEPAPPAPVEQGTQSRSGYGTLAIRVSPRDAVVLIDGEKWEGQPGERLVIELSDGTHRIEVQKSGFTTYSTDVRVRSGQTTTLNVSLTGNRQI
jgi:hypothetical protein